MQRGSSLRSHHIGARRGSSLASASGDSTQLSSEFDQSHKQSAALAEDANDISNRAARAEKRFLIRANPNPQSTPQVGGRKKGRSQADDKSHRPQKTPRSQAYGQRGEEGWRVKPLCVTDVGKWERREYRFGERLHPASSTLKTPRAQSLFRHCGGFLNRIGKSWNSLTKEPVEGLETVEMAECAADVEQALGIPL